MKRIYYLSMLLLTAMLGLVEISCSSNDDDALSTKKQEVFEAIIGSWRYESEGPRNYAHEWTFYRSSEYEEKFYENGILEKSKKGTFTIITHDGCIKIRTQYDEYAEVKVIDANTIRLVSTTYKRIGSIENKDDDTNTNTQKTTGFVDGYEYVDLGLSVKWAKCNLGAYNPEQYGGYYSWGETNVKGSYYKSDYKYYNVKTNQYISIGNNICGTKYDAATHVCGSKWRMPNKEEVQELLDNCTWEWTSINSIKGFQVKGKNGNSIFLPAGGCNIGDDKNVKAGIFGEYWTGNFYKETDFYSNAFSLVFTGDKYHLGVESGGRECGLNVRPVTTYSDDDNGNGGGSGSGSGSDGGSDGEAPYVTSFSFTATKSSITVKFMCNEKPTSATVKYGESSATKSVSSSITGKQVSATASGLKAGTKYYFKCTVKNSYGSSTSDEYSAITNY